LFAYLPALQRLLARTTSLAWRWHQHRSYRCSAALPRRLKLAYLAAALALQRIRRFSAAASA